MGEQIIKKVINKAAKAKAMVKLLASSTKRKTSLSRVFRTATIIKSYSRRQPAPQGRTNDLPPEQETGDGAPRASRQATPQSEDHAWWIGNAATPVDGNNRNQVGEGEVIADDNTTDEIASLYDNVVSLIEQVDDSPVNQNATTPVNRRLRPRSQSPTKRGRDVEQAAGSGSSHKPQTSQGEAPIEQRWTSGTETVVVSGESSEQGQTPDKGKAVASASEEEESMPFAVHESILADLHDEHNEVVLGLQETIDSLQGKMRLLQKKVKDNVMTTRAHKEAIQSKEEAIEATMKQVEGLTRALCSSEELYSEKINTLEAAEKETQNQVTQLVKDRQELMDMVDAQSALLNTLHARNQNKDETLAGIKLANKAYADTIDVLRIEKNEIANLFQDQFENTKALQKQLQQTVETNQWKDGLVNQFNEQCEGANKKAKDAEKVTVYAQTENQRLLKKNNDLVDELAKEEKFNIDKQVEITSLNCKLLATTAERDLLRSGRHCLRENMADIIELWADVDRDDEMRVKFTESTQEFFRDNKLLTSHIIRLQTDIEDLKSEVETLEAANAKQQPAIDSAVAKHGELLAAHKKVEDDNVAAHMELHDDKRWIGCLQRVIVQYVPGGMKIAGDYYDKQVEDGRTMFFRKNFTSSKVEEAHRYYDELEHQTCRFGMVCDSQNGETNGDGKPQIQNGTDGEMKDGNNSSGSSSEGYEALSPGAYPLPLAPRLREAVIAAPTPVPQTLLHQPITLPPPILQRTISSPQSPQTAIHQINNESHDQT
ncbi:MAG: hypothetical protein M1819_005402 [Sarea resinae]|nr:MAG: hypothetical protein M1819_005402 [Sarea resinae]